ncbi:unnamed protein product [Psylliodes chrysocephalus]|uniref:Uncharacterized protein n=1 Tax=Psylliodes chrysocephalus TaxID=3402493 RepID=A0A9P0CQU9_9CUCU|nr:unnamed protein product [Psylliodes chrysocephala]
MADGLCTDDPSGDVIDQTVLNVYDNAVLCETMDGLKDDVCDKVSESESCAIFGNDNVCTKHQGIIEEDCRKKRCVDRYDSSESSDSGVAVLSCTDCSGSSTASSDITDPGSPFSTASSHSEDSGSQPAKMPPTQTAHHPWPPWTADEGPTCKRPAPATAAYPESIEDVKRKTCLTFTAKIVPQDKLISSRNSRKGMQQGKITEYFKSQVKCNGIKRDILNMVKKPLIGKMLVDQQTQFNSLKTQNIRKDQKRAAAKKIVQSKIKKIAPVSVPRKILPAPSNITDKLTISDQLSNLAKFTPTVTLTALSFPPNYTYIHAKGPKPQESPIYVPQIPIPIINRTPCLNVIQPVQKLTAINNFNCVKLNATVVPIVKMPHKITSPPPATPLSVPVTLPPSPAMIPGVTFSVDTAIPTVLSAKPRVPSPAIPLLMKQSAVPSGTGTATGTKTLLENVRDKYRAEDNSRTEEPHRTEECTREEKSPTPTTDSDSGISNKECLEIIEVCVSEQVTVEEQKSPILSKPKTIRFPAKQVDKEEGKSTQHSTDGQCRWTECNSCFDTSGALLEHLQVSQVRPVLTFFGSGVCQF